MNSRKFPHPGATRRTGVPLFVNRHRVETAGTANRTLVIRKLLTYELLHRLLIEQS